VGGGWEQSLSRKVYDCFQLFILWHTKTNNLNQPTFSVFEKKIKQTLKNCPIKVSNTQNTLLIGNQKTVLFTIIIVLFAASLRTQNA
jgi:hypothetical protein